MSTTDKKITRGEYEKYKKDHFSPASIIQKIYCLLGESKKMKKNADDFIGKLDEFGF